MNPHDDMPNATVTRERCLECRDEGVVELDGWLFCEAHASAYERRREIREEIGDELRAESEEDWRAA